MQVKYFSLKVIQHFWSRCFYLLFKNFSFFGAVSCGFVDKGGGAFFGSVYNGYMSKDIIEVSIEHDYLYELGSNDSPSEENLPTKDDDFLSLKISHFLSGKISPISLYLRLGDNHYVKVVNHGSSFEPRSLMSWYSKGLRVVYFSKYEYSKIQKFQHKVLNKVRKDIEAGNDPHPSILLKQGDQILHLFEQTLSSDVLTDLDSFFQTVKALSKSAKMNHKSKFAASFFSANLGYSHGVSSVMATAALLREMGLSSDPI